MKLHLGNRLKVGFHSGKKYSHVYGKPYTCIFIFLKRILNRKKMIKVDKMDDYKKENIFRAVLYTDGSTYHPLHRDIGT